MVWVAICGLAVLLLHTHPAHAQQIGKATGGGAISADTYTSGAYTSLTGPVITETSAGQISTGYIDFIAPDGFEWDTGGTDPTVTISLAPGANGSTKLAINYVSRTTNRIRFQVVATSDQPPARPGRASFGGFRIRPSTGSLPNSGFIKNTGTSAPTGTANYGDIVMVAGAASKIRVETKADGTGSVVPAQNITAGNSLTAYAISRDQNNNYLQNIAADSWTITNGTEGVTAADITAAADNKSATFSSTDTGTGSIRATKSGLTPTSSSTITVKAAAANSLTINTQPSASATAGQIFARQPVIYVVDVFGNRVKSDNTTQITASRANGTGTLQGTKIQTVTAGAATFTDLNHTVAGDITLQFSASGFSSLTSSTITVSPAAASKLAFTTQPPNSSKNVALNPAPVVQIQDAYSNNVAQSGTSVTVTKASGPGTIHPSSTTQVATDSNGAARFDDLSFDTNGSYTLQAAASGLAPATSNSFRILDSGELAQFEITTTSDAPLGDQTAGASFTIKIKALDGTGSLLDGTGQPEYTRKAYIVSAGNTGTGLDDSTSAFSGGVVTHTVALERAGDFTISVTGKNASGSDITSQSNSFNVEPAAADPANSLISAAPDSIVANGSSTSLVTVQLVDAYGNALDTGGDAVSISASAGTMLGSVTDNGDGSYQQSLQSSTTAQAVSVSAAVNGSPITSGNAAVHFVAGGLHHFSVEQSGGGTIGTQTAGQAFSIHITARDEYNNTVSSFNGSVSITSNKTMASGDGTASLTNGVLSSRSITLTQSGQNDATITAANTAGTQTGTSNTFTVNPGPTDPATTTITPADRFIENTGTSTTTITVQARDQYGNNRLSGGETVTLSSSISGTLQGSVTDNGDGSYTQTLQSTANVETATITGTIGGSNITDDAKVSFAEFNEWTSSGSGSPSNTTSWSSSSNWTLGVPTSQQAVFIPTTPTGDTKFPIIKSSNPTVAFLVIESDATLNVDPGQSLTVTSDISGDGTLIVDNATATIAGDISIANFNAGSSTVNLNGSEEQQIPGSLITNILNVENTSPAGISSDGYVNADTRLTVTNSTLTMLSGSTFEVFGDVTGNGTIVGNDATFNIGGDVTIDNIDVSNASVTFDPTFGTAGVQNIHNITGYGNLTINNPDGVIHHGDATVSQTLTIKAGSTLEVTGNLATTGLNAGGGTLKLQGDFEATTVTAAPATVEFTGGNPQELIDFDTFNNLTVNKSAGRLVSSSNVVVNGTLSLASGDLVMGSGTNLLAPTRSLSGGQILFQRILSTAGWYMLSSPIASTYGDFLDSTVTQGYPGAFYSTGSLPGDTLQPNVLYYDETGAGTDNQRYRTISSASDTVVQARGHFVYVFGDIPGDSRYNNPVPDTLEIGGAEFSGTNGVVDFNVTYTPSGDTGFNLVGNPFGATIDWDDGDNWTKTNMDNTIYVWDKSANGGNGAYLVWNGFTGSLGDGLIAPFQGFWVKADTTGPVLKVAEDAKTTGGVFRSKQSAASGDGDHAYIEFRLNSRKLEAKNYVAFSSEANRGKDRQDAYRLTPFTDTYLNLFTTFDDGTQLSINNLPRKFGKPIEIPIHVGGYVEGTPINGAFTLSWPEQYRIPSEWGLLLVDRETGTTIDLKKETFYAFDVKSKTKSKSNGTLAQTYTLKASSDAGTARFVLRIDPGGDAGDLPSELELFQNYPNPFSGTTTIKFGLPLQSRVRVIVYDILGRKIDTVTDRQYEAGYHLEPWSPPSLASGVYLLVLHADGKLKNIKMTHIK